MDRDKLEQEFCQMDMEGFSYWLTNYFDSTNTAFEGEALEALEEAGSALLKVEALLAKIRTEYEIDYC